MTEKQASDMINSRGDYQVVSLVEKDGDGYIFSCKLEDGTIIEVGAYPPNLVLPIPESENGCARRQRP